jgi:glycosyltransferase involved in cell wall biosynthesis
MKKRKIFIEAVPLVDKQVSGVPHSLAGIVAALAANKTIKEKFEIILVAPRNRLHLLDRWPGLETCSRRPIPMKFRIMNGLGRRGLLPKMDLLLGSGIYIFGNYFNWPLTRRSRSFTYLHDICFVTHPQLVQPDNQRMLAKNVPRYIRQTDYVVTVTNAARKNIISTFNVDPQKVVVVYNAANQSVYGRAYSLQEIAKTQHKYGVENQKYFLFIGNVEPRKNLERLLKAVMTLPKQFGIVFVGSDGWLNEEFLKLAAEARQQGRVVIKPNSFVDDHDLAILLHGSIGLVMPSIDEGFGMPALEGLTAGKPVIVSDIPQLREVVSEAGIYCDPYKPASIAKALSQVVHMSNEERETFAQKGRQRAKYFSWEDSAKKLSVLLEEVDKQLR